MLTRGGLGLAVAWMLILATAGAAQAAITVANQKDSGPGSLRQAIEEAPPGETINVPAGTYSLTSGPLQISKGLTISGHTAADTIIRAGGPSRVIESGGEFDLTLANMTIRDGSVVNNGTLSQGGGIFTLGPRLTLRGVVVTGNTADASGSGGKGGGLAQGGGIFVLSGALNLIDTTVSGNTAATNGGNEKQGGLTQGAGVFALSDVTASNSTISGNVASATGGGGPSNAEQFGG